MQTAFVEYKDFEDLYEGFSVDFGSRYVNVYVWRTVAGLERNTSFGKKDYLGAYVANPYRKKRVGLFGEIHLVLGEINTGYVAHEIGHFLYDWLATEPSRSSEDLAALSGHFTRDFWRQYQARIEAHHE